MARLQGTCIVRITPILSLIPTIAIRLIAMERSYSVSWLKVLVEAKQVLWIPLGFRIYQAFKLGR